MNYQETLEFLFSQLPMYQRIGAAAYKADLSTTWKLMQALDHPERAPVKFIHVAGTNGKGSVSHMIASVLQEASYKTGLFTSPHLKDFRERIRINGTPIPEEEVVNFVNRYSALFDSIKPSFFEMTSAMALCHFRNEQVDFAVLETGMGGRLDSTNVVIPAVSVITNIGLDHTQFLGSTIQEIAREKAGIIKNDIPVVTGKMNPDALSVIREIAESKNAPLSEAVETTNYETDLKGNYQHENVATATTALQILRENFASIKTENIISGLKQVVANTGLLGRWQTLAEHPLTICDVGHNEDGIRHVVHQIQQIPHRRLHIVWGMTGDKNISSILSLLPRNASYYFCAAQIPRALNVAELAQKASEAGLSGVAYSSVNQALEAARNAAHEDDLIFVGGSVFVVAEVV